MRDTDICNMALGWLGGNLIMDMDEETTEADICKANYETSIKAALEAVDWTFARSRAYLTPLSDPIIGSDFSNKFQLPSTCLVVRHVSVNGSFTDNPLWEKEKHQLYSSNAHLYIKYTDYIADPTRYTAKFVHLAATQLAADICITLTSSKSQEQALRGKFEMLTDQAAGTDGVQSLPQKVRATTLTSARFGHRRRY